MNKTPVMLLILAVSVAACGGSAPPPSADTVVATEEKTAETPKASNSDPAELYPEALANARSMYDQALAADYAWLASKEHIEQAEQAAANGDFAQALTLIERANEFTELSLKQADTEAVAWQERQP